MRGQKTPSFDPIPLTGHAEDIGARVSSQQSARVWLYSAYLNTQPTSIKVSTFRWNFVEH